MTADVWLLWGTVPPYERPASDVRAALAEAFAGTFGDRCRIVESADLRIGFRAGSPTLHDRSGESVEPPKVVHHRFPRIVTDQSILLHHLQLMGSELLNDAAASVLAENKFWQLQRLALAGLPFPDTASYVDADVRDVVDDPQLPEPCVVKEVRSANGRGVFLAPDLSGLKDMAGCLRADAPYLFQNYLATTRGRHLRVTVLDHTPIAAAVRTSAGTFKSNIAQGATQQRVLGRYPAAEDMAVRATEAVGLNCAGVDLLFVTDEDFVICEVNQQGGWVPKEFPEIGPAIATACAKRLAAQQPRHDASTGSETGVASR
ncbi:RimK family alpha-L-glutamate ligase [Streptomyces sp. NPDC003077]|uniref:ATP-grasp domain-containing protein n=1 Tax=Streptomyces sp. NPDC003077 TaxID=3154443 RepID=UPI0033BE7529